MKRGASRRTLYTIGHSTRSAQELIDILHAFRVTRLVDIRSIPRSRTNPQFNLDVLPDTLFDAGITYVHLAALGGRRTKEKGATTGANAGWELTAFRNYADYAETAPFREGLRDLIDMASRETCAIMCAEAVWWRCHRRIVTDHVLAHGVPVVHLFTPTKGEPASLTPFAVVGPRAWVYYPAPAPTPAPTPTPTTSQPKNCAEPTKAHRSSKPRAKGLATKELRPGRDHQGTDVAPPATMVHSPKSAFHVGDHVSWNSEAGRVRGVIKKKLTAPTKSPGVILDYDC